MLFVIYAACMSFEKIAEIWKYIKKKTFKRNSFLSKSSSDRWFADLLVEVTWTRIIKNVITTISCRIVPFSTWYVPYYVASYTLSEFARSCGLSLWNFVRVIKFQQKRVVVHCGRRGIRGLDPSWDDEAAETSVDTYMNSQPQSQAHCFAQGRNHSQSNWRWTKSLHHVRQSHKVR